MRQSASGRPARRIDPVSLVRRAVWLVGGLAIAAALAALVVVARGSTLGHGPFWSWISAAWLVIFGACIVGAVVSAIGCRWGRRPRR